MAEVGDGRRAAQLSGARRAFRIPKSAEVIAASIRRQITGGKLGEGDSFQPEAQIAEDFGVSRPTVREAFRILESEKLISVSRGSRGGAQVHAPKPDHVARYAEFVLQWQGATYRDVYDARVLIEPPAARRVAETRSVEAPAILREIVARQRRVDPGEEFGRAVASFHEQLVALTENHTLILIAGMLDGIVSRFQAEASQAREAATPGMRKKVTEPGLRSQEKLIELIEAGDGAGAEAHWRAHMENSARAWLAGGPGNAIVDWVD